MRAFARAVPVWAWLAAIVAVSAAIRFVLARGMVAPWIMVDELVYSELAKSFAASGHFEIRGVAAGGSYGFVYPLLISPAYRLFDSVPDAYAAAKAINSVVMSLAALPAYFLARRVLNRPFALAAAALSVAIPSLLYTGTLMTENAFYPVFLCVALVLVRMLERPTHANQLGALALCALAYGTRQQALALFPAVLTAPLLLGWRRLGRFRTLYLATGALAALALVVEAARGRSPLSLLGAYETAGRHGYSVGSVAKWLLWHVAELDLYLGVIPVAAFVVLAFAWRSLDAPQRAFMAGAAALSGWLLLEVAAYATLPGVARVEERNTFYVAPLFLIALLLWVQLGAPRPRLRRRRLGGRRGAARRDAAVPEADPAGDHVGHARARAVVEGERARARASRRAARRDAVRARRRGVVPRRAAALGARAAVARARVLLGRATAGAGARGARLAQRPRRRHRRPGGLDRPRGRRGDDDVGVLWAGRTDPHVVWENEFFNRSVGPVYDVAAPIPGNLAVDAGARREGRRPASRSLRSDCSSATGRSIFAARGSRATAEAGVSVWQAVRLGARGDTRDGPLPERQLVGAGSSPIAPRVRRRLGERRPARRSEPLPRARRR